MKLPPGYRAVGGGALYVQDVEGVVFDGPRPAALDPVEGDRYRWIQGTPPDTDFVMIAIVLPDGHTMTALPAPTSAKRFGETIAVYWCLEGDRLGRTQIEFDIRHADRDLQEEVRILNSLSSLEGVPVESAIDLDAGKPTADVEALKVFLCHSSADKPQVRGLYDQLKNDGFRPWFDEADILPGEQWEEVSPEAVRNADVILVCLSAEAVKKIGYVQKEIGFALQVAEEQPEGSVFIIPVRLEACELPKRLSKYQYLDLGSAGAYERLLKALEKRASQLIAV
jgi:hypothetical protein